VRWADDIGGLFSYLQHGLGECRELRKKILYILIDMGKLVNLATDCFGNFVIQVPPPLH
jgi:hypothetical protein